MVVDRSETSVVAPQRVEWRFEAAPKELEKTWVGRDIDVLEVQDRHLQGRTKSPTAFVELLGRPVAEGNDVVDRVEIRLRVSAGANLAVAFSSQEKVDEATLQQPSFWIYRAPVIAGDEWRTYVLTTARWVPMVRSRYVFLRPTDATGARFEIESLRVVTRREYLATFPSGISWQGLSEIYRETIVSRTPETVLFSLTVPERPWLDLAVGTVEEKPVTFRIRVVDGKAPTLLEHTVSTPYRWEKASVDLARFAGRHVVLSLSLSGGEPGLLGLWGAPTVRSLGVMPTPGAPAKATTAPPQGVILVWVDTLRRDHLDLYGYRRDTGPEVRRMASEGAVFRDTIGQATWTKVATPSLLTSLYPTTHGVYDFSDRLPNSAVTLAECYRKAGYATLSMSSVLFTGRFTNLHKGFEEVQENGSIKGELRTSKTARVFVDRLLEWLGSHREVPFFVFLHVQDPHDPYRPYAPYDTLWADRGREADHERESREIGKFITDPTMRVFVMPNREELQKAGFSPEGYVDYEEAWYDGAIRGMDVEMGRLLQGLRNLDLHSRTLVVFTADHGEEFLEHGKMFHGQSTHGELCNLPLVFWRPGAIKAGTAVEQTVQTIDIMPTLLEMSRLPVPQAAQGHSLLPLLEGAPRSGAAHAAPPSSWPAIVEKIQTKEGGGPPPRETESHAVILDGWKLIHNEKRTAGVPEFELYDHRTDPLDLKDVAQQEPAVVKRLSSELEAWRRLAEARRLAPDSRSGEGLGKDDLERLRALGYIQ
jgi:arylsulfatase A-like enzyme